MPPKTASKKTVDKVASKIVEDKTFGLKNKNKSKKVQSFVESVKKQAKSSALDKTLGKAGADEARRKEQERKAKEAAEAAEKEMMALMRASVKQPKLEAGVDPKSVLCEFFKAGCCDKGDRCKYSHDLTIGRKSAKIDIYTDARDAKKDKEAETNADWDQAKLEEVVRSKHGAEGGAGAAAAGPKPTEIVCKYFLDAIERETYGWFWRCPNGEGCKYRHALPPGYVYKSKKDRELEAAAKALEEEHAATVEELIEEERRKLPTTGLTPVTAESFAAWKKRREEKRASELEAKRVEEAKKTGTKGYSVLSGRALFSYDPSLFVDDDAADDEVYEVKERDAEEEAAAVAARAAAAAAGGGAAASAGVVGDADAFLEGGDDVDDLDDLDDDDEEGDEGDGDDGDDDDEEEEEDGEETAAAPGSAVGGAGTA